MTNNQPAATLSHSIEVIVRDKGGDHRPLAGALIGLYEAQSEGRLPAENDQPIDTCLTDRQGRCTFSKGVEPAKYPAKYYVVYEHYPKTPAPDPRPISEPVTVDSGEIKTHVRIEPPINATVDFQFASDGKKRELDIERPRVGDSVAADVSINSSLMLTDKQFTVAWDPPWIPDQANLTHATATAMVTGAGQSNVEPMLRFARLPKFEGIQGNRPATMKIAGSYLAEPAPVQAITGTVDARLDRTSTQFTDDVAFWTGILNSTETLSFDTYAKFMDYLFCGKENPSDLGGFEKGRFRAKRREYEDLRDHRRSLPFTDTDAYRVVKAATEAFVMVNCGVLQPPQAFDELRDRDYLERRGIPMPGKDLLKVYRDDYLESVKGGSALPYLAIIRRKLPDIGIKASPFEEAKPGQGDECYGILQEKLTNPCLMELIWSYWHEEGMLAQTTKAIARRFQNVRSANPQDPLSNQEIDPLRPLNNLIWGHIQDEQHRLTVVRRNYEYDHHYGLRLEGKAVQAFRPADTRSKFLEAFHNLLRLCTGFYKQDDDTTVKADAFPVLNALKEVHLILSQGAHNQFGDLTSTARIEMMMEQWLLARPEFREFLPTRIMVAYPEPWMDRVDAMKKLQGWTDTSVLHFRNLGVFGEQILLAVRYGAWSVVYEPLQAFNWARFWRPQVQGYVHAYRAATGVDLAAENTDSQVEATLPSILLQKRLAMQQRGA